MQEIPIIEKLFIGGNLNGHVRTSHFGFDTDLIDVHMKDLVLGKEMKQTTRF